MATSTDRLLTIKKAESLKAIMSTVLFRLIGVDPTGDTDVVPSYAVNLNGFKTLVNADLVGINNFKDAKELVLPKLATPLTQYSVDLTNFNKLERMISYTENSCPFGGDISDVTTLKNVLMQTSGADITSAMSNSFKFAKLGLNPNLETFSLSGQDCNYGTEELGNLSALRKLKTYLLNYAGSVPKATIDNILETLAIAKAANCPLTVLDLTGTRAPTGGAMNANYLALVAAGVTVTLGAG